MHRMVKTGEDNTWTDFGLGLLPHAKMLHVPMNCFLWLVDYVLDENVLTEQMWIFAAYFILRDHDTHFDFLRLLNCKALHFAADFKRVLGCLISSKCLLDLNNSKPFSFCLWMSLFTAMFCHVGPSSLAFFLQDDLFPWWFTDVQISKKRIVA